MDETHVIDTVDQVQPVQADGEDAEGFADSPESPANSHRPVREPVELPEPPEKLYVIRITGPANPADPELAAALEEMYKAADRDPNRFRNNPEKERKAREGFRRFFDEWQAENGAFTEEERARARELLYGPLP